MRGSMIRCSGVFVFCAALAVTVPFCPQAVAEAVSVQRRAAEILETADLAGGLIVHLGCGDGTLTAELRAGHSYMVQGFDTDAGNVDAARRHVTSLDLYGPVAIDRFDGRRLPLVDNLANLIVADDLGKVSEDEIMRVLAPGGAALIGQRKIVKPRPPEIDDWTHYLYDSTNNAVAHDAAIGPPRHLQWIGSPRYSRQHDHMSAASAMVASGGRLFSIFDYASPYSIQLASDFQLVARDAFNGTILWKRPIQQWQTQMFRLKSGPAQLTRRLVAIDDKVYVTLGLEAPLSCLDAATGKTLKTYEGTAKTEEIIYSNGVLFLLINDQPFRQPNKPSELVYDFAEGQRRIVALDANSGEMLWNETQPSVLPITLTADEEHVLFCGDERIFCLDRQTGKQLWQSEPVQRRKSIPSFFGLTLVAYEDVVLFSGGSTERDPKNATGGDNTMYALDAKSGETLWTHDHPASGYKSAEDILVVDGLAWITENTFGNQSGVCIGLDPKTGEKVKEFVPDVETHWFHHRCYRAKATDNYLLFSRTGIEFVDPKSEHWQCHHWVRGACLYGILPANGMVYNPPHPCACYLEAKLYGFNALAPTSATRKVDLDATDRLEKGPAYGDTADSTLRTPHSGDWPTYRHDAARSGFTSQPVSPSLAARWETNLGGRLSPPVVAGGRVFVASIDKHTVHALEQTTGRTAWSFTAGARVDSPPTYFKGRVLFGSADGYVYCLRARDGAVAWRFRAAPLDRRHCAFEQLESVWPVHGSVLIRDAQTTASGQDELWCVAGRSLFLDGGLRQLRLNPTTGEVIGEKILDDRDPDSGDNLQVRLKGLNMPVALNDVLSCDGKYVYMKSQRFDAEGNREEIEVPNLDARNQQGETAHLFCPTGFLDDVLWHRSYWVYGRIWKSGAGGYYQAGRVAPAGRPMVFNDSTIYGYGRLPQYYRWTTPLEYQLFASAKQPELIQDNPRKADAGAKGRRAAAGKRAAQTRRKKSGLGSKPNTQVAMEWTQSSPELVRAMVLADKTLFVAGPADLIDEVATLQTFEQNETQELLARQAAVLDGSEGGTLRAVSTTGGQTLSDLKLDFVPVFDGMAAAGGKLFMATTRGRVVCFAGD